MRERLPWLDRAYFVAYTAGQILPTSIGGDAVRILETSRRHPARLGAISAIVLLERALGGAATVLLGAIGFLLAIGRYDVGAYLWLEGVFVVGTLLLGVPLLRPRRAAAARADAPLLARLRLERPLRALYDGVHAFRDHGGCSAASSRSPSPCRRCASSPSGRPRGRSGSRSRRGSTT